MRLHKRAGTAEGDPSADLLILATGIVVKRSDADQLINEFEATDRVLRRYHESKKQLALAIAALSDGDRETRRVEGRARRAKVEMPGDHWNGGKLFEAWNAYPQHRDRCLRISRIDVRKREWDKLDGTSGPPDLEQFVRMVRDANDGPSGTPRITVEK